MKGGASSARRPSLLGPWLVVLAGLSCVALFGLSSARVGLLVPPLLVAGAGWVVAVRRAGRAPREGTAAREGWPLGLLAGALLLRVPALLAAPALTDDPYRYVWEAGLVLEGRSPYAHAPADPALGAERARLPALFEAVGHPEVSAAYPPLTQAACAGLVALAGGPAHAERAILLMRVAFAVADLLVLLPLLRLCAAHGRARQAACAWGFSPLVALEFAGNAHFDALGILLLVAGLAWAARPLRAGALLALGGLVKLLPLVAVPFAAREARGRAGAARVLALAALVAALGFAAPLLLRGGSLGLTAGLADYALRWESFSLLYRWLERPLAAWLGPGTGWHDPRRLGRTLALAAYALWLLRLWRRGAPERPPAVRLAGAAGAALAAFLVLTPTLHPWYLTWIVPFLALRPAPAWLWLVAVAPVLYWPLEGWRTEGVWSEPGWLWPLVALPFWGLLLGVRPRVPGEEGRA